MTRPCAYQDGDVRLDGIVAADPGRKKQPGVLLVHGGGGLDEHARGQAIRYAQLGYAVLAADMYGREVRGDRGRILTLLQEFRDDPPRLCQRGRVGLTTLRGLPEVDGGPVAAVGFCFGGMAVLALARQGEELAGVVSMHGSLAMTRRASAGEVRARILVCHGARDPHVPIGDVTAFVDEMTGAEADWQLNVYGSAMHGFTHVGTSPGAIPGVAYDEPTDRRSFAAARDFLVELFAAPLGH